MGRFIPLPDDTPFDKLVLIDIPDNPSASGWDFDIVQIAHVMQNQNVNHPIRFRFQGKGIYRLGTHYVRKLPELHHLIVMNHKLPIIRANETLWHELAHVIQSEQFERRTGHPMSEFYKESYKHYGQSGMAYTRNPYEIQARDFADSNKHILLLTQI
jgi:hypothetical protein